MSILLKMGLLQLNKDISVEETSSQTSGNSSGGGDDISEHMPNANDFINHLDEKNLQLSEKLNEICALEEKLREKETEIFDLQKRLLNYERDRETSLLTVIFLLLENLLFHVFL